MSFWNETGSVNHFFPFRVVMLLGLRRKGLVRWPSHTELALFLSRCTDCLRLQKGAGPHLVLLQGCIVLGHTGVVFGRSVPVL